MPHGYTEDQLVEQPAIGLFAGLGWLRVEEEQNTSRARAQSSRITHQTSVH
jgi:type I restriction enzyme R subunit